MEHNDKVFIKNSQQPGISAKAMAVLMKLVLAKVLTLARAVLKDIYPGFRQMKHIVT